MEIQIDECVVLIVPTLVRQNIECGFCPWCYSHQAAVRQRLKEGDQPLPQNPFFILCLFPTSSALFPFCQAFLCASSSFLPKIGIEYPHKTHTHTHTQVRTCTHPRVHQCTHTNTRGATDSSETAADSSQSHEASLQLMWLIHKKKKKRKRKTLINAAPLSQAAHYHCVPRSPKKKLIWNLTFLPWIWKKNNILYKEFLPVMSFYCQLTTT